MPRLRFLFGALFISSLSCCGPSAAFWVRQTPPTVTHTVRDGSPDLQISCCLNISTHGLKVKWIKDEHELKISNSAAQNQSCFTLLINNAQKNCSGIYICEITQDIPKLKKINGSGTIVNWTEENSTHVPTTSTAPQDTAELSLSAPLLGASVSIAVLVITTCVCVIVWRMNKCRLHTDRVVIREGPPSEQEEPGSSAEDSQSSRNSRGSALWYMVPVYESYFDLQRSDEPQCAKSLSAGPQHGS